MGDHHILVSGQPGGKLDVVYAFNLLIYFADELDCTHLINRSGRRQVRFQRQSREAGKYGIEFGGRCGSASIPP